MNRSLLAALALCACASANAAPAIVQGGLSLNDASAITFAGYNGTPADITGVLSSGYTGSLSALTAGTITFTYLGQEAGHVNTFDFNGQTIEGSQPVGTTLSAEIGAGTIAFSFSDLSDALTRANGHSYIAVVPGVQTTRYGSFDFVLGFDDSIAGSYWDDGDHDDLVVGVNFVPANTPAVPEPTGLALTLVGLAGLAAVGRASRRV